MKKLFLTVAVAMMATTAFSAKWAVVGAYTNPNWNFEASTVLEGSGNELTCEIANLTPDFKIVDIENNNWDNQYGSSTPLVIGQPLELTGKNGGSDPSNITFANNVQVAKNAKVTFNESAKTLLVESSDLVIAFPDLYVTGSFCGWTTPGDNAEYLAKHTDDGIYTVTFDLGDAAQTEFKLAGRGWSNEIAGGTDITADAAASVTKGGSNLKTTLTGTQTLTFNINTMKMTFGDPSLVMDATVVRKWAVVGAYSDPSWNFEASTILEGEGDVLTCEIANLTSDFKIVDIQNNNWDTQYGAYSPLVVGQPIELTGKEGNNEPGNIRFANNVQVAKNAKVTFTVSTKTLLVESSDLVVALPELYATGSFCNWTAPGENADLLAKHTEAGIYSVTIDLGDAEKTEFKLAGPGWTNEIAGGVEVTANGAADVTLGGGNLYTTLTGSQTLTFNINTMKMTFGDPSLVSEGSMVDGIETSSAAVEYYNLNGVRVSNPSNGLYIVKQGKKVSKMIVH